MRKVKIILSPEAEEVYRWLNQQAPFSKTEKTMLNAVRQKAELIKQNPHYGEPIAKKLIPKEYLLKYGIRNLFRIELPNYWRMLYTLRHGETQIEIISFILDIIDHKDYNKKFGYR